MKGKIQNLIGRIAAVVEGKHIQEDYVPCILYERISVTVIKSLKLRHIYWAFLLSSTFCPAGPDHLRN